MLEAANPISAENPEVITQSSGRQATFTEFIFKVAQRCNMACDYCYMYEHADQSYRKRPAIMDKGVVDSVADELHDYFEDFPREAVSFVLHGGEPLLQKYDELYFFLARLGRLSNLATIRWGMQTNGTLLTQKHIDLFKRVDLSLGVSLDGDELATGRHRLFHTGENTFHRADRALKLLQKPENQSVLGSILCAIDLDNDPIKTYEHLASYGAPAIDFLLPLGNYTHAPPGRDPTSTDTPYADWLIPIFERWHMDIAKGTPGTPRIRRFEEIFRRLMHQAPQTEYYGVDNLLPSNVVIESDGTLHAVDALKSTREGFTDLDANVFQMHCFDHASSMLAQKVLRYGIAKLPDECRACDVVQTCGGGWYVERYKEPEEETPLADRQLFARKSVYHPDHYKLITHIRDTVLIKD